MSRDVLLARGREALLRTLRDSCTILHPTGQTADDSTGVVTPTGPVVYDGPCRFQRPNASPTDSGEVTVVSASLELQLPVVGTEGIVHGDRVTVTAAAGDATLVGRIFTVSTKDFKSEAVMRKLTVEEVD